MEMGTLNVSPLRSHPLPARLIGSFIGTFFAPHRQAVFVAALFVKLTLCLPLFAFAASLLFHTINNPMTLLISAVSSWFSSLSRAALSVILAVALPAPVSQSIFGFAVSAEFTLVFPLFAFRALLHFCYLSILLFQ